MGGLGRNLLRLIVLVVSLIVACYYLSLVLLAFAETRSIAYILIAYVTDPLFGVLFALVAYAPSLVALVIITAITRFIIKGGRLFFEPSKSAPFR